MAILSDEKEVLEHMTREELIGQIHEMNKELEFAIRERDSQRDYASLMIEKWHEVRESHKIDVIQRREWMDLCDRYKKAFEALIYDTSFVATDPNDRMKLIEAHKRAREILTR